MWSVMVKPQIVNLTKTLAKKYAEMEPCPNDRPVSEARLDRLKGIVKSGQFRSAEWCSAWCEETKKEYRVNGKHTSTLFAKLLDADNTISERLDGVKIIVTQYNCKSTEDVALLYSSFDSKLSVRSTGDINKVYAQCDDRLATLSGKIINLSVTALAFLKWGPSFQKGSVSVEDRAHQILESPDAVLWYNDIISSPQSKSDSKAMKRAAVTAAMIVTYRKAPLVATEFWTKVRDASSPDREAPDRVLNRLLITSAAHGGNGANAKKNTISFKEFFDKSIYAWNAYRQGKQSIQLKYYPEAESPKPR